MVGNEEGKRHFCGDMPGVCSWPQCGRMCPSRTCLSERCFAALEGEPFPPDGNTENKAARKTRAAARLHDPKRGGKVSLESALRTSLSSLLPHRLVHRIEAECDNGPKVVDGES